MLVYQKHINVRGETIPINAQVAQSVEQRTENPRVGGSIPSLGIKNQVLSSLL